MYAHTPYTREILENLDKEPLREVVVMKGAAMGKSTSEIIPMVGFIIDNSIKSKKMATEKTVIEVTTLDIIKMVAEKYNLNYTDITYTVSYWRGDAREAESLTITVKGTKKEAK